MTSEADVAKLCKEIDAMEGVIAAAREIAVRHDRLQRVSTHMKEQARGAVLRQFLVLRDALKDLDAFGEADGEGT